MTYADPSGLCGPICVTAQRILEILKRAGPAMQRWADRIYIWFVRDPSRTQWVDRATRVIRVVGNNPQFVHEVRTGRLAGYLRFVTTGKGSLREAMRLFQQLTGKTPSIMGDSFRQGHLEVLFRSASGRDGKGGPVIEIGHLQRTLEKVHFVR